MAGWPWLTLGPSGLGELAGRVVISERGSGSGRGCWPGALDRCIGAAGGTDRRTGGDRFAFGRLLSLGSTPVPSKPPPAQSSRSCRCSCNRVIHKDAVGLSVFHSDPASTAPLRRCAMAPSGNSRQMLTHQTSSAVESHRQWGSPLFTHMFPLAVRSC